MSIWMLVALAGLYYALDHVDQGDRHQMKDQKSEKAV
jgi:hypothetical protein